MMLLLLRAGEAVGPGEEMACHIRIAPLKHEEVTEMLLRAGEAVGRFAAAARVPMPFREQSMKDFDEVGHRDAWRVAAGLYTDALTEEKCTSQKNDFDEVSVGRSRHRATRGAEGPRTFVLTTPKEGRKEGRKEGTGLVGRAAPATTRGRARRSDDRSHQDLLPQPRPVTATRDEDELAATPRGPCRKWYAITRTMGPTKVGAALHRI